MDIDNVYNEIQQYEHCIMHYVHCIMQYSTMNILYNLIQH